MTIQRKEFFSIVNVSGVVGLRLHDGYEIVIDDVKFNAYLSESEDGDSKVYILDPEMGVAIFSCSVGYVDSTIKERELIDIAMDKFADSGVLDKFEAFCSTESYAMQKKIFSAYMNAESMRSKQRELLRKETGGSVQLVLGNR